MTVRAAGYVIVRKIQCTYEYLLLQASYPDYHWSPPKGHVDPGEDEARTALREVEEESGYKKDDLILHDFEQVQQKHHGITCWKSNAPKCVKHSCPVHNSIELTSTSIVQYLRNHLTDICEILHHKNMVSQTEDPFMRQNFKIITYVAHGKPKTVVFWLAELKNPEEAVTLSHEHKDYRWLPCTEAGNLAKFQETKDLFNACEEFLKSIS